MEPNTTPQSEQSPDPLPEAVRNAANGNPSAADELGALDFLLGATVALEYDVDVKLDTPSGTKSVRFRIRQQDPGKLDEIDARNRSGEGPFAKLDVNAFNAELVAFATVHIEELETGRKVAPSSVEFRTFPGGTVPSAALAMGMHFKYQPGILEGIAERIREISGFGPDRVGKAQRVLVEAGKTSSPEEG